MGFYRGNGKENGSYYNLSTPCGERRQLGAENPAAAHRRALVAEVAKVGQGQPLFIVRGYPPRRHFLGFANDLAGSTQLSASGGQPREPPGGKKRVNGDPTKLESVLKFHCGIIDVTSDNKADGGKELPELLIVKVRDIQIGHKAMEMAQSDLPLWLPSLHRRLDRLSV